MWLVKKMLLSFLILLTLKSQGQIKLEAWCEKFQDLERNIYSIINADLSYTFKDSNSVQFTYWSTIPDHWPYLNFIVNWRSWSVSLNPLKPDIYNYTIQITYNADFSFLQRRRKMVR